MRQRGLGNPQARGGNARKDATDAITKKFQHMQSVFKREGQIDQLKNADSDTRNNVLKLVERKIKETVAQLDSKPKDGTDANLRAQLAAWNHWKTQFETKGLEKTGAVDVTKNFYAWLLGKGIEEDHRRTPWYREQALLELPDVQEWIDGFSDVLSETQNELIKLAWKTPQNLEEAWLYYKYVVHMDWMQKEDRFFWVDMVNLMEEKARLGGGYLQSELDNPQINTPSQAVTKDGEQYLVPLTQNDAFDPSKFPAFQPLPDARNPRVTLGAQLREMANVHKLENLDPVVPKISRSVREAALKDILEANDQRSPEEVAAEVVEAVTRVREKAEVDVAFAHVEQVPELAALATQNQKLVDVIEKAPKGWGAFFRDAATGAALAAIPGLQLFVGGESSEEKTTWSPEQRAEVQQAITDTRKEIDDTIGRVRGKALGVEVVDQIVQLEDRLRVFENQLRKDEEVGSINFRTASGELVARDLLVRDSFAPLDTRTLVRQADFLSAQATRGLDDVKKETVKQATRLAVTMEQFETDRTAILLAGYTLDKVPAMQNAFQQRWQAALTGLGVTDKHKTEWAAKGIDLNSVATNTTNTQNFVKALFSTMDEEAHAFFNMSKYASMQRTWGSLRELLPQEFDSEPYLARMREFGMEVPADLRDKFSPADYRTMQMFEEVTRGLELQTPLSRLGEDVASVLKSFGGGMFRLGSMSATQWVLESAISGAAKSVILPLGFVSGAPFGMAISFLASLATQSVFGGLPKTFDALKRQATNALMGQFMGAFSKQFANTDFKLTMAENLAKAANEYTAATTKQAAETGFAETFRSWYEGSADAVSGFGTSAAVGILATLAMMNPITGALTAGFALQAGVAAGGLTAATSFFGTPAPVAEAIAGATGSLQQYSPIGFTTGAFYSLLNAPNRIGEVIKSGIFAGGEIGSLARAQLTAYSSQIGQSAQKLGLLSQYLAQNAVNPIDNALTSGTIKTPFFETPISNQAFALLQVINGSILRSPDQVIAAIQATKDQANKAISLDKLTPPQAQGQWYQWLIQQNLAASMSRSRAKAARRVKPPKTKRKFLGSTQSRLDQRTGQQLQ